MFTGIIQAVATIAALRDQDGLRTFTMEFPAGFCENLAIGASVSHDGVCLTVTENLSPTSATFDVMLQSLNITTLGQYQVGDAIETNHKIRFGIPEAFRPYVFAKGYIAVNGASLTVAEVNRKEGWFEVWLIPETLRMTVFGAKKVGDQVNIEIERSTQVVVDTVRETVEASLGRLKPVLEALLAEKGLSLDDFVDVPKISS